MKKHILILEELPALLNRLYTPICRNGRPAIIKSKAGRESTHRIKSECTRQGVSKPLDGELTMKIDLDIKKQSGGDIDAALKNLLDSMEGYAFHNDSQIVEIIIRKHYNQGVKKLTVLVEKIEITAQEKSESTDYGTQKKV